MCILLTCWHYFSVLYSTRVPSEINDTAGRFPNVSLIYHAHCLHMFLMLPITFPRTIQPWCTDRLVFVPKLCQDHKTLPLYNNVRNISLKRLSFSTEMTLHVYRSFLKAADIAVMASPLCSNGATWYDSKMSMKITRRGLLCTVGWSGWKQVIGSDSSSCHLFHHLWDISQHQENQGSAFFPYLA